MMKHNRDGSNLIWKTAIVLIVIAIVIGAYVWLSLGVDDEGTITLYGFSVKGEVFNEKIIPSFVEYWKEETENDMEFQTTYAGSGKITNQVIMGAPAEVMVLSTEWDAIQLKKNGLVTTDWREFPHNGTVSKSPWIIMTRAGNPKGISDFPDLAGSGIEIIHGDPQTSGGACWSIFSIYGSALRETEMTEGKANTSAARELLRGIVDNVISWQSSARKALTQFDMGYGDAIITYENEALLMRSMGKDYEIIYPPCTIFSEHKVVIVDKNVNSKESRMVDEFVQYLYTDEVQGHLADYGFRSINETINAGHSEFPIIPDPFTVDYLGGWEKARAEIIEGVLADIR